MKPFSTLTGRPAHPGGCYHCKGGTQTCICPGERRAIGERIPGTAGIVGGQPARREIGQHEPGAKLDDGKVDLSFLADYFPLACEEICRISEFGAKKYTRGGWRAVPEGVARYTAAMFRHLFLGYQEKHDSDGLLHAGCVAWNAMARLQMILEGNR